MVRLVVLCRAFWVTGAPVIPSFCENQVEEAHVAQ
jgi:hypothetical protein